MTDSYRATPQSAPPDSEPTGAEAPYPQPPAPLPPAPPPRAVNEPEELTLDTLPKRSIDTPNDASSDEREQEADRQVWRPPLPQYPPRPERQAPVQYEAPRVQPAPQYTQQQYTPPQSSAPPAPQPQPQQQQSYAQMQQQPSYAATAPVTYLPPRPVVIAAPPAPKISTVRMGRRMARRAVMGVSSAGKVIFGARPGLMAAFLVLLLFTGWLAYGKWFTSSPSSATPNAPNANGMIALPPEVPAVQSYLTATGKDDPDAVWDTLAPAEKANRITNGEDKTVLAAVLDAEKQYNFTTNYRYVGGLGMNGSSDMSHGGYYFYVQDVTSGTQQHSFPMYFSVDDQGKITTVNDQLYKLILQQLKGGN